MRDYTNVQISPADFDKYDQFLREEIAAQKADGLLDQHPEPVNDDDFWDEIRGMSAEYWERQVPDFCYFI